jgi:hypothetical protein
LDRISTPKCKPLKHTIVISLTVEIMLALGAFEVETIFILLNAQHSEWRNAIEPIVTNQNVSRMYVSEFREWNFHLYPYGNAHLIYIRTYKVSANRQAASKKSFDASGWAWLSSNP